MHALLWVLIWVDHTQLMEIFAFAGLSNRLDYRGHLMSWNMNIGHCEQSIENMQGEADAAF